MCHQDTIKGLAIHTLQCATKKERSIVFHEKNKQMGTGVTTGRGLQKLDISETTLKSTTLVKTHSTTKDIQEWMKWSFLANYCCERGRGGAFCASHKQSFLPLSPAIERDTLARRDGWSGEEQSRALAVRQLTSRLVLQTSLMTSLTVLTQNVIFTMSFSIPSL